MLKGLKTTGAFCQSNFFFSLICKVAFNCHFCFPHDFISEPDLKTHRNSCANVVKNKDKDFSDERAGEVKNNHT